MKKYFFMTILSFLFLIVVFQVTAQSNSNTTSDSTSKIFDTTNFPQWAKDLRRFDIITFGSFPFSIFTVTFLTDLHRWNVNAKLNFSKEGRKYAPWPFKSAGAIEMTNQEYINTILIAAGLSAAIALTDYIIILVKREKERKRNESRSSGSILINRMPYGDSGEADDSSAVIPDETEEDHPPDSIYGR